MQVTFSLAIVISLTQPSLNKAWYMANS